MPTQIDFGLCPIGMLYSIYLTYIEVAILRAIYPCGLISAIIMIILFALAIVRVLQALTEHKIIIFMEE